MNTNTFFSNFNNLFFIKFSSFMGNIIKDRGEGRRIRGYGIGRREIGEEIKGGYRERGIKFKEFRESDGF